MTECEPSIDWTAYAADYDSLLELDPYRAMLENITGALAGYEKSAVLDAGCGTGNLSLCLSKRGFMNLCGFDGTPAMLKVAQSKLPNIPLKQVDLNHQWPAEDGVFAVVCMSNVLYALDPAHALFEADRVLQPGGRLVLTTPREGFSNGEVLRSHAGVRDEDWSDIHVSEQRALELLSRTFPGEQELVESFLRVAAANSVIAESASITVFDEEALEKLLSRHLFVDIVITRTYADQTLSAVCTKGG